MYKNRDMEIDLDAMGALLKDAVSKVKTQENPDLLNSLKKVYKKNVPFALRTYVAAYLAKETLQRAAGSSRGQRRDFKQGRDFKDGRTKVPVERNESGAGEGATDAERRPARPRVEIDPALAATVFIGIGRNRRVFARDLVGLLISVAGLERERIGDIRVLANYSFIQLFADDADKAIAALNGYEYRGRKLSASFSRQKEEGSDDMQADADSEGRMRTAGGAERHAAEEAENSSTARETFSVPHHAATEDANTPDANDGGPLV